MNHLFNRLVITRFFSSLPPAIGTIAITTLLLTPTALMAHPGHETMPVSNNSAAHYWLEPAHGMLGIVIVAVLCGLLYFWFRRSSSVAILGIQSLFRKSKSEK